MPAGDSAAARSSHPPNSVGSPRCSRALGPADPPAWGPPVGTGCSGTIPTPQRDLGTIWTPARGCGGSGTTQSPTQGHGGSGTLWTPTWGNGGLGIPGTPTQGHPWGFGDHQDPRAGTPLRYRGSGTIGTLCGDTVAQTPPGPPDMGTPLATRGLRDPQCRATPVTWGLLGPPHSVPSGDMGAWGLQDLPPYSSTLHGDQAHPLRDPKSRGSPPRSPLSVPLPYCPPTLITGGP